MYYIIKTQFTIDTYCSFEAQAEPSVDYERLLAHGRADNTTNAAVTVTVYVTPQTR